MTSHDDVLACYRKLAITVARMLDLARAGQWEQLPWLDALCTEIVEQLRSMEPLQLSGGERSRFEALADRIHADRQELTRLVQPQFLDLVRAIAHDASGQRNAGRLLAAGSANP